MTLEVFFEALDNLSEMVILEEEIDKVELFVDKLLDVLKLQ